MMYGYYLTAVDRGMANVGPHRTKRNRRCTAWPFRHECPRCRRERLKDARKRLVKYWHTADAAGLNAPVRLNN